METNTMIRNMNRQHLMYQRAMLCDRKKQLVSELAFIEEQIMFIQKELDIDSERSKGSSE